MYFTRTRSLGLSLLTFCALGTAFSQPVSAQNLHYTLDKVTFADGAVATGTFDFNPTTGTFGAYDVTTTNGLTDGLTGLHYLPGSSTPSFSSNYAFYFSQGLSKLIFNTVGPDGIPGVLPLQPGTSSSVHQLSASGEFAPPAAGGLPLSRPISAGNLIATAAAVPEASTTVSLGLLLALSLGGLVIAAKRKKQST